MKRRLGATASAAALLLVAACGGDSDGDSSNGGEASEDVKVAVVLKTFATEFWQEMKEGVEDKGDELGIEVEVSGGESEDDVEGQLKLLENAVGKNYDAIGVAPISPDSLNNAIREATDAGIPVANLDEQVDMDNLNELGGSVQAFITTDNVAVGGMAADFIADNVNDGAEVAIIEGKSGNASGDDRRDGAREQFEEDGLNVVESQPADWDRTKANDVAENFLSKYPDLEAIYAANDTMAMGAQSAVSSEGRDVVVVGTDGNSDAIESVEDGQLAATVKQDSYQLGQDAVEKLYELATSDVDLSPDAEVEEITLEGILIDE